MKNIIKIFSILIFFSISIFNIPKDAISIGNVDWELLKENKEGKEWLDKGSIKTINDNELSVLTRFFKSPTNPNDNGQTFLYVMRINCNEKNFKDTSINGIPQFNSKWQSSNNDELINVVIEKSCLELKNK